MTMVSNLTIAKKLVLDAAKVKLPEELTDPHGYIRGANSHVSGYLSRVRTLPTTLQWDVLTPGAFAERAKEMTEVETLGLFYMDQIHQAQVYMLLTAWKIESLLRSLVRSLNASDLVAPALLSRGLMEHATSALVHVREAIGVFDRVGASDFPVSVPDEQMRRIEESLARAIWGTRIGTSKLHDKTPLWGRSPYVPGETMEATNIVGAFQKVAREVPDVGKIAFRVYEWLCDIVHPATQGLRLFWEWGKEVAPGHQRFSIDARGRTEQAFAHAIVLWGVGYSLSLSGHTHDALAKAVNGVQSRLEPIYGLTRQPAVK